MNHALLPHPIEVHVDQRNPEGSFYDREDLLRLRARALHRQQRHREALEHFRRARVIAAEENCAAVVGSLDLLEANASEAMTEDAAKVTEYDKLLAAATPESRWTMVRKS
jgi:hypothetical protein